MEGLTLGKFRRRTTFQCGAQATSRNIIRCIMITSKIYYGRVGTLRLYYKLYRDRPDAFLGGY